ncbi:ME3 isoform 8, partial [Pongo abelii]
MGAALGTGTRLAPWPGRACGALPRWAPTASAQGCHSKPGPARPVPLKKRGYDVTRNPHLNKV